MPDQVRHGGLGISLRLQLIGVAGNPVASIFLAKVKSDIRTMNKMLVIGCFRLEFGNANADGDRNSGFLENYGRLGNDLFQFFSDYDSSFEIDGRENDAKLLPAIASQHVNSAQQAIDALGYGAQNRVPGQMSAGVINFLEVIEIEEHE